MAALLIPLPFTFLLRRDTCTTPRSKARVFPTWGCERDINNHNPAQRHNPISRHACAPSYTHAGRPTRFRSDNLFHLEQILGRGRRGIFQKRNVNHQWSQQWLGQGALDIYLQIGWAHRGGPQVQRRRGNRHHHRPCRYLAATPCTVAQYCQPNAARTIPMVRLSGDMKPVP